MIRYRYFDYRGIILRSDAPDSWQHYIIGYWSRVEVSDPIPPGFRELTNLEILVRGMDELPDTVRPPEIPHIKRKDV